ncbi:unnamed protein product [Rotaria sordida]|uniref:Uncharacterized protein n=1 Tax=Rotaria sordida TaxID=392033 RepID=A0A814ZJ77_9BILA|nr:unnamed protein product [Rotaria sordida]CAF1526236.1 unnamed protein product [Rotaria sordida]
MLLVWCERTTFHNSEPINDNDKSVASTFFQHWMQIYLKKPDEILPSHLSTIPKYGGWGDLKIIYVCACQIAHLFPNELPLLENLKSACVRMVGDQLKYDHRVLLKQSNEPLNTENQETITKSQDWISNCANEAPRISNNSKKFTTVMAKEIAQYLHLSNSLTFKNEPQLSTWKGQAYENYRCLIGKLCRLLEKASPAYVDEQAKLKNRNDRAQFCTKVQREQLLTAPPASTIIYPIPQPLPPCSLKELKPLLEYLSSNKPGPCDDKQPIVFPRGTLMTGGRLDLCKQVVGPQSVQPLLDAMKHSSYVSRLLLGNNIVGLPGAKGISEYIRCNSDSKIDTWYIACNTFDSECISLICEALAKDSKVKALWLKRNPIGTVGSNHITRMLMTNTCLQTLDLFNTGLLDEGYWFSEFDFYN